MNSNNARTWSKDLIGGMTAAMTALASRTRLVWWRSF